jgi:Late embryogenesis abundant protein
MVKRLWLLSGIVLLLTGCLRYEEVELLGVERIAVERWDAEGLAVHAFVRMQNPNNYRIHVEDPDVDLYLNGSHLGKATFSGPVVLQADATQTVDVPLVARFENGAGGLLNGGLALLFGKSMDLEARGTVRGRAGLLRKRVPFTFAQSIRQRN